MRIFVCDDSAGYRMVLRTVLDAEPDLRVVGDACDGRECIDDVRAARPDVVLLDINMPRMSGLEALPELRAVVPDAKIVVLTTHATPEHERESRSLGADGFLEKPHSAFDVVDAVRSTLAA